MSRQTPPTPHVRVHVTRTLVVVSCLLALFAVPPALAGPGGDTGSSAAVADPEVTNVTATATDTNVTITVEASGVTEVDVRDLPEEWTVLSHRDDFGTYLDQTDEEARVVWLWPTTVPVSVSVTFSAPVSTSRPATVTVEPYDGTTPGPTWSVVVTDSDATASPTGDGGENETDDGSTGGDSPDDGDDGSSENETDDGSTGGDSPDDGDDAPEDEGSDTPDDGDDTAEDEGDDNPDDGSSGGDSPDDGDDTAEDEGDDTPDDGSTSDDTSSNGDGLGPGFGPAVVLATLAGVGYLLNRLRGDDRS